MIIEFAGHIRHPPQDGTRFGEPADHSCGYRPVVTTRSGSHWSVRPASRSPLAAESWSNWMSACPARELAPLGQVDRETLPEVFLSAVKKRPG